MKNKIFALLVAMSLALSACQMGAPVSPPAQSAPPGQADVLVPTSTSDSGPVPTSTPAPAVSEPTIPSVVHLTLPETPSYSQALPEECNTGFNYKIGYQVKAPCDTWRVNLLERAVSADSSTFYHYLDILAARMGKSGDWYYASLDLFGAGMPADNVPFHYYFEFDLNQDGRGDVLLSVENLDLYAADWTVAGVRVWADVNDDIGGLTAVRPDPGSEAGDGYETLLFDQGLGEDPDLAWVRHDPNDYRRIEFAFKPALLQGSASFMWWAGAMRGQLDPRAFDFVDTLDPTSFFEIDTTCGWVFGFEQGYNLHKCYLPPVPPTQAPAAVCVKPPHPNPGDNGWVWNESKCKWELWN